MTTLPQRLQQRNAPVLKPLPPLTPGANPHFLRRENTQDGRLIAERAALRCGNTGYRLAHLTLVQGDRRMRLKHYSSSALRQMAAFCLAVAEDLDCGWVPTHKRS